MKDIVAVRKGMRRRARGRGLAGLAALGTVVIAAVVAGWGVSPGASVEISAADVVALRFPSDWTDATAGSAPPSVADGYALASGESRPIDAGVLFTPHRMRALSVGTTALAPISAADEPASPSDLHTSAPTAPRFDLKADAKAESKPVAQADMRTAAAPTRSLAPAPQRRAAPQARKDSGTLFNDAQLASIKSRLRLSAYQEQYWPPVESALRDIGWRASHEAPRAGNSRARLAEIDPDSPEVQRLKSAAFPLIMSMDDDQKREVRMLAQVMGLERVAASF